MKNKFLKILLVVILLIGTIIRTSNFSFKEVIPNNNKNTIVTKKANYTDGNPSESVINNTSITYQAHVANIGWQQAVNEGNLAGTTGRGLQMEAIKINVNSSLSGVINYKTYSSITGWEKDWKTNNAISGTEGKARAIEAIQIELTDELAQYYKVYYRTHVANIGWLGWASNGETSGNVGYGYAIEAIEIRLIRIGKENAPTSNVEAAKVNRLEVSSHVAYIGWQGYVREGELSGTTGRSYSMEAIKMRVNSNYSGSIQYKTYSSLTGWENGWKLNNDISGSVGKARAIEAIKIELTGELAEHYDVYYHTHVSNIGWLGWTSNGETSGSIGYGFAIEAIEVRLVEKGKEKAPSTTTAAAKINRLEVSSHVSNIGWQGYVREGEMSGTTGRSYSMEALKIKLNEEGTIKYETYVHGQGWQSSKTNNQISGTTGKGLPLHAIKITLEGAAKEKYDILYRAHLSNIGWMDWVSNGEIAGQANNKNNLEAIQIVLKEKEIQKTEEKPQTGKTEEQENQPVEQTEPKEKEEEKPQTGKTDEQENKPVEESETSNKEEKEIDPIEEEIKKFLFTYPKKGTLDISKYNLTKEKVYEKIWKITHKDHTFDYFQISVNTNKSTDKASTIDMSLFVGQEYENYYNKLNSINKKINEIVAQIPESWSDFEQALYVHDWIGSMTTYDVSAPNAHDIDGVLIDGRAVCQGMTNTFNTIMYRLGIDTTSISGESHTWSEVNLDGEWYHMDITYDNVPYLYDAKPKHNYTFMSQNKTFTSLNRDISKYRLAYSKSMDGDLATNTRYDNNGEYDKAKSWIQEAGPFQPYKGYWYNGGYKYGVYDITKNKYVKTNEVWVYKFNKKTKDFERVGTGLPVGEWKDTYNGLYIVGDQAITRTENEFIKINLKTGKTTSILKVDGTIKNYYIDYTGIIKYKLTGDTTTYTHNVK